MDSSELTDVVKNNDIDKVREVLRGQFNQSSSEPAMKEVEDYLYKSDILITAVENRVDLELIDLLVQNGADINATNDLYQTPLYLSIIAEPGESSIDGQIRDRDYYKMVSKLLIHLGTDISIKSRNESGEESTTAVEAAQTLPPTEETLEIIEELKQREKIDIQMKKIVGAIDNLDDDSFEEVESQLEAIFVQNSFIIQENNGKQENVFIYAIKYYKDIDNLGRLLTMMRNFIPSIISNTSRGKTPLMVFLETYPVLNQDNVMNLTTIFEILLEMIPNPEMINERDFMGQTLLDYAIRTKSINYIDMVKNATYEGAKRGKAFSFISNRNSIFYGMPTQYSDDDDDYDDDHDDDDHDDNNDDNYDDDSYIYSEPEMASDSESEQDESESEPIELPEDPLKLKEMFIENIQTIQKTTSIDANPDDLLKPLVNILNKNQTLINEKLEFLDNAPAIFAIFDFKSRDLLFPYLNLMDTYDADLLATNDKNQTVLEVSVYTVDERNIFEILVMQFSVEKLIVTPVQGKEIYEKIVGEEEKEKGNATKKPIFSEMKLIFFAQLFFIVIMSDSDENYTWLPPSVTSDIINENAYSGYAVEYLSYVCKGIYVDQVIKNDEKIFDYLMERKVDIFVYSPEMGEKSMLNEAIFRLEPVPPSPHMVEQLLINGAQLQFNSDFKADGSPKGVQDMIYNPNEVDWNVFQNEKYADEYAKITALLYQAIAIQLILSSPFMNIPKAFVILSALIKYHPEAFSHYPKPPLPEGIVLSTQEIDPNEEVFDVIMQGDEKVKDFLNENREDHIVLQDYDKPSSKFLVDVNDILAAIGVDHSPLESYQYDERSGPEREEQTEAVAGPGKKGGRAIIFPCKGVTESFNIQMLGVNNMEPYVNLNSIAGWGGLVPLLELYEKILSKKVEERGQYFSYKVLDAKVDPIAGVGIINFENLGVNRYGGQINVVSASHCQEGQYGQITTIVAAKEKAPTTKGGESKNKNKQKKSIRKEKLFKTGRKTLRKKLYK